MTSLFPQSKKTIFLEIKEGMPLDPFSMSEAYPILGTKEEGYSPIYRNMRTQEGLISTPHPSITTLKHVFDVGKENFPNSNCIGVRTLQTDGSYGVYKWENYSQIDEIQKKFGAGVFFILQNNPFITESEAHSKIMEHHNVVKEQEMSFILTIYSHNRREWCITDLACSEYSITNTSLYDTLGKDTAEHILGLTESPIVVCSKDKIEQLIILKENNPELLSNLIAVVLMDRLSPLDDAMIQRSKLAKIAVYDFDQVVELGGLSPVVAEHPTAETVYTISFTSGTTSMPKGVVLTHANAVSGVTFCLSGLKINDEPRFYCFLPLAHIYQRMVTNYAYLIGSAMGMPQSASPLGLIDDLKELKPHSLALVPRVFTKLESAIKAQTINNTDKPILQKLFANAVKAKTEMMLQADGAEGRHIFYDRLIGLLRKKLGFTDIISVSSGSAPISVETVKFLKSTLNMGFSQGYGLTESFAGVCGSLPYEADPGSCGPVSITTEIKLRDLPVMNYTSEDAGGPRGELMLRGPQIFREYYKDPQETAKVKDNEGWFSTGDVASIDKKTGRIFIIDRVKNFFKIAQGEYITPEKIENTYLSAFPLLSQILVHGDSLKTYLVSIIGVDPETIKPWIKKNFEKSQFTNESIIRFMNEDEVKVRFLKDMNASVGDSLHGFERVHNLRIAIEPMKIEDDIITPTMKIKRVKASKFFLKEFSEMYEEGSLLRVHDTKL
ncbi:long-chain-fatty-acid CoA ligase [Metschnikowia bicuspidata var. bicuspidata NRRL YB-4993]|uniref:Long-chain-fatty-acid CoA ligase n=1 Tax=Metschnikowia bicuspidata var. bicuspidata NRRL YB-4993 TaxID=869754 RepID=A0A1A0H833_9ASCO|nr:long-chain-fatty-acid CoA ligase [Metschnikowia bicuspidata var. bicuspidata NRRL YB-4993]OBA20052.1 long-chain-fatty-acid CoA ligase [Metschnikowia bicuspidata var. bicuspidata NRRL YB-4993]